MLRLSRFSRVRLYVTPKMAAHEAPLSLGFSRQEHWSGLPFPSPMHESESEVVSYFQRPHGLRPTRLLHPRDFPGKSAGVGCHLIQITQSEQQKEEPMLKIKNSLRDLWYIPSMSTFSKVLSQINVEYFQKFFLHNVY